MAQVLTGRNSVVALRIKTLFEQFVDDSNFFDPPLKGVSYGDQVKIPDVPWLCIEPSDKTRDWPPTPTDMTEINLEVYLYVYYLGSNVVGTEQVRLTTDQLSEAVEEYLNVNHRQLKSAAGDDLVIYSYVVQNQSGYTQRGALYRSARLTWRGRSKLRLTQAQ
jgi:hypothetical protein